MEPSLKSKVIQIIASDPRGRLSKGDTAYISYGGDVLRMGQYREVKVVRTGAGSGSTVVVAEGCRRTRLAGGLVLLKGAGSGVLLLAGAFHGAAATVRALVENGVHIAVVDEDYNTPLHLACMEARVACACELLDIGATEDTLLRNVRFMTPVGIAGQRGLTEVSCKVHVSPGARDRLSGALSRFPLIAAAQAGDAEAVSALLRWGAPVDAAAPERSTALSVATEEGHVAVMQVLIAARADLNHTAGVTPDSETGCTRMPIIYLAAKHARAEALSLLVAAAANLDAGTSTGCTALHKLVSHSRMVRFLLDSKAHVDARTVQETALYKQPPGSTPLVFSVGSGHAEVTKAMLGCGADPNSRCLSPAGRPTWLTPLHFATVAREAGPAARLLVAAGADVNGRIGVFSPSGGLTALMAAAVANNPEVIEALLEAHADPELRCTGRVLGAIGWRGRALDMARKYGRAAAIAMLEAKSVGRVSSVDVAMVVEGGRTVAPAADDKFVGKTPIDTCI